VAFVIEHMGEEVRSGAAVGYMQQKFTENKTKPKTPTSQDFKISTPRHNLRTWEASTTGSKRIIFLLY
jgi:hypothetical protein